MRNENLQHRDPILSLIPSAKLKLFLLTWIMSTDQQRVNVRPKLENVLRLALYSSGWRMSTVRIPILQFRS